MVTSGMFTIDPDKGIASIRELKEKVNINVKLTWDNSFWKNMNPNFAQSDVEKEAILERDILFSNSLEVTNIFVASTPHEATILDIDRQQLAYFRTFGQEVSPDMTHAFFPVSANGFIVRESNVGVIFAPRDCAIFVLTHPDWHGFVTFHAGAMQAAQDYQHKILEYTEGLHFLNLTQMEKFSVWITPYICPDHYIVDQKRKDQYLQINPKLESFFTTNPNDQTTFDFVGYIVQQLKDRWHITDIHEPNVCNYESAQHGSLYSRTLSKQNPDTFPDQGFNVGISKP